MRKKLVQLFIALWYSGFMVMYYFDDNTSDRKVILMGVVSILAYMFILDMMRKEEY